MNPTIEQRVGQVEHRLDRIESILMRLDAKIVEILLTTAKATDLAEVKGRVGSLPTWWMLTVTVMSTWMVGAGIVFALVKASQP